MTSKKFLKKIVVPLIALIIGAVAGQTNYFQPTPQTVNTKAAFLSPTKVPQVEGTYSQTAKVVEVIDGDTIKLESGEKVRLIGMDTPELHHPTKPVQCFAKEAMLETKRLVEGKTVRLEKDVSETDRYGRLLRFVYIPVDATLPSATQSGTLQPSGTQQELFLNDYLVKEGYAHATTFPPDVKYADLFRQSERTAMENNKGLWKNCN